jgi:hypothetical protein
MDELVFRESVCEVVALVYVTATTNLVESESASAASSR